MKLREKIRIGRKIVEGRIFKKNHFISVEFCVTRRCNLSCRHCFIKDEEHINFENIPIRMEMSLQEINKAFSTLNKLGVERINISGGEPLVREDIGKILEDVILNKFKASLTTNGMLVPKYIDLLAKLDFLVISIDGAKETHEYLRGKNTHDFVLKAIDLTQKKGIKTILSAVITKITTEKDLLFLLNLCDSYNIFCIFQPVWDVGFYQNGDVKYDLLEQIVPTPEQLEYLYTYLENSQNKKRVFGGENFIRFILDNNKKRKEKVQTQEDCMAGKFFLHIASNGSVFPCSMRFQKLLNKQIYECSLEEISKMKIREIKCPGCSCYSYMTLNKLVRFNLYTIIHSLCNSYI